MKLIILSPEQKLFDGEITRVKLPGEKGGFELLKNHAPLISSLVQGEIAVYDNAGEKKFNITGGFVECLNNEVTVLVEGLAA